MRVLYAVIRLEYVYGNQKKDFLMVGFLLISAIFLQDLENRIGIPIGTIHTRSEGRRNQPMKRDAFIRHLYVSDDNMDKQTEWTRRNTCPTHPIFMRGLRSFVE